MMTLLLWPECNHEMWTATTNCSCLQLKNLMKPVTLSLMFGAVVMMSFCFIYYTHSRNYFDTTIFVSPPSSSKKYVMLLSYGRSGSSFTAALIAHHPDVFYTFEPLYFMARWPNGSENEKFVNIQETRSKEVINSFFTCQFPVDAITKLDNKVHRESDSSRDFYACLNSLGSGFSHLLCFQDYLESCKKHRISLIKTIRFRVKWAEWFLRTYPEFKIIILIRDPRATLLSQSKVFMKFDWKTEVTNFSDQHCQLLADDLLSGERLIQQYPDRVLGIRYEDGAKDPFQYAQKMYRFLGLEYDGSIDDYVKKLITKDRDESFDPYSIQRGNTTLAMNRWRYKAGIISVNKAEQLCGHLFPRLGYKFAMSQRDLESDRSLVGEPAVGGIFR